MDCNIFSVAYSALMYFTLAFLPWKFLWNFQMKRGEKIGVGAALSIGVFAGVTAVIKTTKLPRMMSSDFGKPFPVIMLERMYIADRRKTADGISLVEVVALRHSQLSSCVIMLLLFLGAKLGLVPSNVCLDRVFPGYVETDRVWFFGVQGSK